MGANRLTAGGTYMYVTQGWTSIPSMGGGGGGGSRNTPSRFMLWELE